MLEGSFLGDVTGGMEGILKRLLLAVLPDKKYKAYVPPKIILLCTLIFLREQNSPRKVREG